MKSSRLWFWVGTSLTVALTLWSGSVATAAGNGKQRVIIYPSGDDTEAVLQQQGVSKIEKNGTYWLGEASSSQMETLGKAFAGRVQPAQHLNKIELSETSIDVTAAEPIVPAEVRSLNAAQGRKLQLVQFKGPVLAEWLKQLKSINGVRIINYVPNNAYLVSVKPHAQAALQALRAAGGPVQWTGDYLPAYKVPAVLRQATGVQEIKVGVDGDEGETTLRALERFVVGATQSRRAAAGKTIVRMQVNASDLTTIAELPGVLWIQQSIPVKQMDEVQGLVLAGKTNAPGGGPIFPADRYLNFLQTTVGFSTESSEYPVLDIADSGVDRSNPNCGDSHCPWTFSGELITWHPAFNYPAASVSPVVSECSYPFNTQFRKVYDFAGDDTDGHGTVVASVAVGYDVLPDELINCYVQTFSSNCTVSIVQQCVTNSFTIGGGVECSGPFPPACCPTLTCTNFNLTCTFVTNVSCVSVCDVSLNNQWYLSRRDSQGFQLGLGISPFGRFGASSYTAAALNPEEVLLNVYLLGGGRISNNSWGELLVVGGNDGLYGDLSQSYDALTRDAVSTGGANVPGPAPQNQEMLFIFAGGNNNGVDPVGGYGDVLTTPPATAKNVIAVGATDLGHPAVNTSRISVYSSFGPTSDGRFKPDVVAPGSKIAGATSQASYSHSFCGGCDPNSPSPFACEDDYQEKGVVQELYNTITSEGPEFELYDGTSFAAPAVSGAAQLLWWYFQNRLLMLPPSPAMMKAYILNSARYLNITNPLTGAVDKLPSIAQGMGMMDLARMFDSIPRVLRDQTTPRAIDVPLFSTNVIAQQTFFSDVGQSYEVTGQIADATQPYRVTLTWTDPPGTPGNGPQLVNNLDLQLTINGRTYYGNSFNTQYSKPDSVAVDTINNVESIFLPAGTTGTWSVVVRAAGINEAGAPNVDGGNNQDFALVVYNALNASDVPNLNTNDACQTAQQILAFPFSWTNNLAAGVYHNNHPSSTAGRGGDEEFFSIEYPTIGTVFTVNTMGSANALIPIISVWKGQCGTLVEVASARSNTNQFQAVVSWTVTDTNIYYIVAEGLQNRHGQLALNVKATPPPFGFDTSLLDFGTNYVGFATNITVAVRNQTGGTAIISQESITGPGADSFFILVEDCVDKPLVNGSTCNLTLTFAPLTGGVLNATLNLFDNITGSPHTLALTGFGLAPVPFFCQSASGLAFGEIPLGFASAVQSVSITNCGTADLIISSLTITGAASNDFSIVGNTCSNGPIVPGGVCSIDVVFAPVTQNVRVATLLFVDNTTAGPHSIGLSGSGKLPAPSICVKPTALGFGNVPVTTMSTVQSVVVSNCGSAVLTLSGVSLSGAGAGEFVIASNTCLSGGIAIGGTCTIGVRMAPTVIGAAGANLVIDSAAAGLQKTVPLTGNGTGSQPDASIDRKLNNKKPSIGVDLYTPPTPITSQTLTQRAKRGKPRTYYVRCQNDGNSPDTFMVGGSADMAGVFAVKYFLGSGSSALDITAAVKAGTFATASLEAGAITSDSTLIQVQITPDLAAPVGTNGVTIAFQSTSNVTKVDATRAQVVVR